MMNPWPSIRHLFEHDDGSLPDIFVDGLSSIELVTIYDWLMSRCDIARDAMLWDIQRQKDVLIRDVSAPAQAYVDRRVEAFRHGLSGLFMAGVSIPELSVAVEGNMISFDYRMGSDWDEETVGGLFSLLRQIHQLAPKARIFRTGENAYQSPDVEFDRAYEAYRSSRSGP